MHARELAGQNAATVLGGGQVMVPYFLQSTATWVVSGVPLGLFEGRTENCPQIVYGVWGN